MSSEIAGFFGPAGGVTGSSGPSAASGGGGSRGGAFRYPSAFWDVAQMRMPTTIKALFARCRYHAVFNPLVSTVVKKMSEYPLTKVIVEDAPREGFKGMKRRWEDVLFRSINIHRMQIEIGLDYFTYGNAFLSLKFPFKKYLKCPSCEKSYRIETLQFKKDWSFRNWEYHLKCKGCNYHGKSVVVDNWVFSPKGIRLIKWSPENIHIDFNPITQEYEYQYEIPKKIQQKVARGHRRTLETMPHSFILALKRRRKAILDPNNVYHFKAPTPSLTDNDDGWGYPIILPALKDSYYLQIMKKAQEAVLLEHMLPLDVFYPATGDQTASPFTHVNLGDWKKKIELEIQRWRLDPNYKPVMPLPLGYQRLGGNGRALMLTQEIRAWSEHIIAGMSVPQEFVFGGLTWSGSSVSLRMLENMFLTYRTMHQDFMHFFLIPHIARFMSWPEVNVHMQPFKMADDIQAKQMSMSLAQMGKLSDTTLLGDMDKDAERENDLLNSELHRTLELEERKALGQARIQLKTMETQQLGQLEMQTKLTAKQQKAQESAGQQGGGGPGGQGNNVYNLEEVVGAWTNALSRLTPEQRKKKLDTIRSSTPSMAEEIEKRLGAASAQEVKPNPEIRPPRGALGTM